MFPQPHSASIIPPPLQHCTKMKEDIGFLAKLNPFKKKKSYTFDLYDINILTRSPIWLPLKFITHGSFYHVLNIETWRFFQERGLTCQHRKGGKLASLSISIFNTQHIMLLCQNTFSWNLANNRQERYCMPQKDATSNKTWARS